MQTPPLLGAVTRDGRCRFNQHVVEASAGTLACSRRAQDTEFAPRRQRHGARKAVITRRHCRLKRIECTLLLKHLTGMGSPKTALGLMTPVAYEVRTGVHCGHCKRNQIG